MRLTKKEHIIPRMLLSQFVAADGRLRVYEKGKPLRVSRPENECVESRYFEFEFRGRKRTTSMRIGCHRSRGMLWLYSKASSSGAPSLAKKQRYGRRSLRLFLGGPEK